MSKTSNPTATPTPVKVEQFNNSNPSRVSTNEAVVTTDSDDRVSLWPLDGETALAGLLATPPKDD